MGSQNNILMTVIKEKLLALAEATNHHIYFAPCRSSVTPCWTATESPPTSSSRNAVRSKTLQPLRCVWIDTWRRRATLFRRCTYRGKTRQGEALQCSTSCGGQTPGHCSQRFGLIRAIVYVSFDMPYGTVQRGIRQFVGHSPVWCPTISHPRPR